MVAESRSKKGLKNKKIESDDFDSCDAAMCALMSAAKVIQRYIEKKIEGYKPLQNLSGPRIGVLFVVHKSGAIRLGDLAAKLDIAARTATDMVDGLERDGFLRRRPDPTDRRALLVELTPEAHSKFEKIAKLKTSFVKDVFGHFSEQERNQLVDLLSRLKEHSLLKLSEGESEC
jgi:DNA-binding MarR family transcriptional regulator